MGCLKLSYYENFYLSQERPLRKFEGQEKNCVSLLYFGARYYNSDISVWLSVDPMSDERPSLSPYHYCSWNPVMLVDPDGMLEEEPDWVKHIHTNHYVWFDNVTSSDDPDLDPRFTYIGSSNNSILEDLNLQIDYYPRSEKRKSMGLDEDKGMAVPMCSETTIESNLEVSVTVGYDVNNGTQNNKYGRTFIGISFTSYTTQKSEAAESSYGMRYLGYLGVNYGGKTYTSQFGNSENSHFPSGSIAEKATVRISAQNIYNSGSSSSNAFVSMGTTNPNLLYHPEPVKISWNTNAN